MRQTAREQGHEGTSEIAVLRARVSTAGVRLRAGHRRVATRELLALAAALERRRAWTDALGALEHVVRADLRRGRWAPAQALLDRMMTITDAGAPSWRSRVGVWTACGRLQNGDWADAGALARGVRQEALAPLERVWATLVAAEAGEPVDVTTDDLEACTSAPSPLAPADLDVAVWCVSVAFRRSLAAADFFDAGRRLAIVRRLSAGQDDSVLRAGAAAAHAEWWARTGQVERCRAAVADALTAGRRSGAAFDVIRACAAWVAATRRLGRAGESASHVRRLRQMRGAVPASWRQTIDRAVSDRQTTLDVRTVVPGGGAAALVRAGWGSIDDEGLPAVLAQACALVGADTVDLVLRESGRHTPRGRQDAVAPDVAAAVFESSHAVGPVTNASGTTLGVPVRAGRGVVGALVASWVCDAGGVPPEALDVLDLAVAVVEPHVARQLEADRRAASAGSALPQLVGTSAGMGEVRRLVARAAGSPFSVLIEGESGVGKEVVARALHQLGQRHEGPWRDVNCAALPDDLLESELFGHARGAFSGAVADRAGLFEDAHGGTLFLDEVADLSLRAQAKVLRAIQQQEVRRVGESQTRHVDVRLVAAANRDLGAEVAAGRFRLDLFYRLAVIRIGIPPLRERPEDIRALAEHCWADAAARMGSHARLSEATMARLERHTWPGNVRELQNVMAALAVVAPRVGLVPASALPAGFGRTAAQHVRALADTRADVERRTIVRALATTSGNRTEAARALGLSRQGLQKALRRLDITGASAGGARPGPLPSG